LLLAVYVPLVRGAMRVCLELWFILIAFSTLLTHQHQVLDVVSGQLLGLFCLHVFPGRSAAAMEVLVERNFRIGWRYGVGAIFVVVAGYMLRPWGLMLWWPGGALACVAWGYIGAGPGIFRKRDGRLALSTRVLLGPYLLGAWISSVFYKRRCEPFNCVAPGLFIGCSLSRRQARALIARDVRAVLDLTAELGEARALRRLRYENVPILDLTRPSRAQLVRCVAFIRERLAEGGVYVHCALGFSRSVCVAAAYLIAIERASTVDEAIAKVELARPAAVMGNEIREALEGFAASCRQAGLQRALGEVVASR
jgi:protein phosphatase